MKVTILGCGTSAGVPRIGNDWGACDPDEPRNRRTRASILIEEDGFRLLVDTSPDLRAQFLREDVERVDAVIWTHDHADHCHGIDDLRQVFHAGGKPIPGFARAPVLRSLRNRFSYVFEGRSGYPAIVDAQPLADALTLGPLRIEIVDQPHGRISSAGLKVTSPRGGTFGYSTDCHDLTSEMARVFERVDAWVVDALRAQPHPSHSHLQQTLSWIERVRPSRALLTHMDQSMDYRTLRRTLPRSVEPAHDGLAIYIM